jgi:hypothetical protein
MDRPNGVHNEDRTFLDRITQLKSILRNRRADGREETAKARLFDKI